MPQFTEWKETKNIKLICKKELDYLLNYSKNKGNKDVLLKCVILTFNGIFCLLFSEIHTYIKLKQGFTNILQMVLDQW